MKENTLDVINKLTHILEFDNNYKQSWIANIAMSYIDCELQYKKRTGKKYLNKNDKHSITNEAAENFLNLLMKK